MSNGDALRFALDKMRSVASIVDRTLVPFTVQIKVRNWTGERVGLGTLSDTDGYILVADGYHVHVKQITQKDVIASAGLYQAQDMTVGPFTPTYVDPQGNTRGFAVSAFDPPVQGQQEIIWILNGPGL